eukprot:CAMPEP_0184487154 /NCGR_PEP_ID=MMETSP0113_2-20130426/9361_1 /TAXON_ID=91329 /ORGANISM="Norrisiella sphaerica, Strain BC52" /LENGTH=53 /DNA_ID=CAMNT_0026869351 /DNA_START=182 /DNA_END=343 /DNA_ORIENTATION=+
MKAEPDKGITGAFEVYVNGKLIHSKKGGKGFVDSKDKMAIVVQAIIDAGGKPK